MTLPTHQVRTAQHIEARYQNSFGRAAGYLPKNRAALDAWLEQFSRDVHEKRSRDAVVRRRSVDDLQRLIERDGIIRMYVSRMIADARVVNADAKDTVRNIPDLLDHLDCIVTSTPRYYPKGDPDRNFFPLSSLFCYMMMTEPGYAVFRDKEFNRALLGILREWCAHLDSPDSRDVLNEEEHGWLSQAAKDEFKLDQFQIDWLAPHGGFASYNTFFHRGLREGERPIGGEGDARVVVAANDGRVVRIRRNIQRSDDFWAKGQKYSLHDMLDGSDLTDSFIGGDVFQSFLSGADYHRWHAPVTGIVRSARVVEALMFTELEGVWEPSSGTESQVYGASVNTRGLVFIESPAPIGTVCVMPLGMTEISSVTLTVRPGDHVTKGDQLGYFNYGGSSMCLLFQKGAIDEFTVPDNTGDMESGHPIQVNGQIARAFAPKTKA